MIARRSRRRDRAAGWLRQSFAPPERPPGRCIWRGPNSKNLWPVSQLWIFPRLRGMIRGGSPALYEFELGPAVVTQWGY